MEKIFGEVDFVEAGENETAAEKIEASAYSTAREGDRMKAVELRTYENPETQDDKPTVTLHEENI